MSNLNLSKDNLAAKDFRRILLIKPSSLGDVIHALPVLDALHRRYPNAAVDWLIGTPCAPLLAGHSAIKGLVEFDRRRLGTAWWNPAAAGDLLRFMRSLRRARYDLVIDLQGLIRTAWFGYVTGASTRIGFADAREGAPLFYTHKLPGGSGDVHAVDRNLQVASLLGIEVDAVRFPLELSAADRMAAGNLVSHLPRPIVALVPGARWETKCWPASHYRGLIDAIASACPAASFVLLGSGDESALCMAIAKECSAVPINLAGRTALPVLACVIDTVDIVVCQDSAAAHLAAALDRPLVCLTGPTNPHRTGPYRRIEDVLRLELDCSPCYFRRLSQCPHGHRCLRELDVETVAAAALEALVGVSPGASGNV